MINRTIDGSGVVISSALFHAAHGDHSLGPVRILFLSFGMRLDNRSDLLRALVLAPSSTTEQILIAAWKKWGEAIVEELRGPFAFALYDARSRSLFLARDIFGLCPLYYAFDGDNILIASGGRCLRSLTHTEFSPDNLMIADFVSGATLETERTFFTGIARLPPACTMRIDRLGATKTRYWSAADIPEQAEIKHADEQFRALFDRSSQNCFVPGKSVLLLSGGLDSSAIAGSLHSTGGGGAKLPSFSLTYPQSQGWGDREHLLAISERTGASVREYPSDAYDPLSNMEHWLSVVDGPYLPVGHSVSFRLLPEARDAGYSVVLSGHGGDEIVSYGFGRLNELAMEGRWWELWRATSATANLYGDNRLKLYRNYLAHFNIIRRLERHVRIRGRAPSAVSGNFLAPTLALELDPERYRMKLAGRRLDHTERMLHEEVLASPLQPLSLEVYALCSQASGVETRLPFYDRDLVELCVSLPSDWKLRGGLSRFILREAMRGDVPESILRRQDKFDFGENFVRGLCGSLDRLLSLTDPSASDMRHIVNISLVHELRARIVREGPAIDVSEAFFLWRVAILSLWLNSMAVKVPMAPLRPIDDED